MTDEALPPSTLILCSRDRPRMLAETVASILDGLEVPTEMVIVDQSRSAHPEVAAITDARCDVRYRWTRSRGLSRARNEGIREARNELLVFTDDDVAVTREWFGRLVRALLAAGPRSVATGRIMPAPAEDEAAGFVPSTKVDPKPAVYEGRIGADVIYPHNMALYADTFVEVGPFDPRLGAGSRFGGAEDNDFCHRALEAGYRIHYVPDAILYHRAWRSTADYLPLRWSYGRGQGAYYAKHLSLRDRYMLGRLGREITERLRRLFLRVWRQPLGGLGEGVYLLGLMSAVVEWPLTQRGPGRDGVDGQSLASSLPPGGDG